MAELVEICDEKGCKTVEHGSCVSYIIRIHHQATSEGHLVCAVVISYMGRSVNQLVNCSCDLGSNKSNYQSKSHLQLLNNVTMVSEVGMD